MSLSANLTTAQNYKNCIQEYGPMFISKGFYDFKTMAHAVAYEGNKGVRTLTEITIADIVYAWTKSFSPKAAFNYIPREIRVRAQKIDLGFVPQEFEGTYIGALRKPGQNPGTDLPAEAMHIMKVLAKLKQELERAIHRGVLDETIAEDNRKLIQNINGFDKIITDELSAGKITPLAVPTGAWTVGNVIETLEKMYFKLDDTVKEGPITAYCPLHVVEKYKMAYRAMDSTLATIKSDNNIKLDFGDVTLVALPGKQGTNRVWMTPEDNVFIDFDNFSDTEALYIETVKRELHMWADFKVGCNLGIVDDGIVSVCDIA